MLFAARFAASAVALILVATYYLLASIPFSYYHFLQFPHFWWLPIFIRLHPLVLAAALAAALPRRSGVPAAMRRWIRYVALAGATATTCMVAIEAAPVLLSYELAAALAFVPLLLLAAAAAINIAAADCGVRVAPARSDVASIAGVGAFAGFLIGVVYTAAGVDRGAAVTLGRAEFAAAAAVAVAAHVVGFTSAALVVGIVRRTSRRWRWSIAVERFVIAACAAVAGAIVVRRSLLSALVLSDLRADLVALAVAAAIAASAWAAAARIESRASDVEPRWLKAAILLVALIVLVAVLPPRLLLADWGGSLQKIVAMLAWAVGLALVATARPGGRRRHALAAAMWVVVVMAAASTAVNAARGGAPTARGGDSRRVDLGVVVDRYATFDPSLGVLLDVVRPVVSDREFYRTVRDVGDATDDRSLPAVPMSIADVRRPLATRPPNIFIVVVDSLRPDYLSAYNPSATFAPAIGAFANESVVMHRAFTQYAGTALSQPAIWAGGLIQRAMYVKPFAAVDNLERLTVAAGYRRYISVDEILSTILEDWSGVTKLDSHIGHPERLDEMYKFDLCTTVPELIERLDRDGASLPIFFYSQPQNLHIRVLAGNSYPRDERVTVAGASFFKPAVSALTRLDGCFGRLIDDLKARGLYDDSIVVLTADHGDSYGEAGRWAHAFYMAPEILRIPLILHVPQKYLEGRRVDREALALLTDVTPTLYDLVGYPPAGDPDIAGRSLFPGNGSAEQHVRDLNLVQSSYSRVYGLLDSDARSLYIADANHDREEFFDLTKTDPFPRPVAVADRPKFRKWLLDRMARLNQFYARPKQRSEE